MLHPPVNDRRDPTHRETLPDAVATCASVIGQHFRNEIPEARMREHVRAFARDMHAVEVPPERAIARLKEAILHVPEVSARPALERGELLRLLVQDAIGAYYTVDLAQ